MCREHRIFCSPNIQQKRGSQTKRNRGESRKQRLFYLCFPSSLRQGSFNTQLHFTLVQKNSTPLAAVPPCPISSSVSSPLPVCTGNCQVQQSLRPFGHNTAQKCNNQSQLVLGKFHPVFKSNTNMVGFFLMFGKKSKFY